MPTPLPFTAQNLQAPYPALYLYPLNDSFAPKHIPLAGGQRQKIGRQTNTKTTTPGERNGYFDSKVLSRQHAEIWEEEGKIYIKDVKSSNGTFINGDRLSPEGADSQPWVLNSDDIVEFGIDIIGEDNKTVVHHKVAARVVCVFTEQDVQVATRAEQHQQHQQQYQNNNNNVLMNHAGPSSAGGQQASFNFNGTQQRRTQLAQQGLAGMGGMGGSMRPPGKSGLTFDHILSRLQGELQKSRETGAELNSLTGTMNEIHETLGGGLPLTLPSYPTTLPGVRTHEPPSEPLQSHSASSEQAPVAPSADILADLQSQLQNAQLSLASHVEKIRSLEDILQDQENIKCEVRALREMIETRRREIQLEEIEKIERDDRPHCSKRDELDNLDDEEGDESEHDQELDASDDEEDSGSIHTIIPHELEIVEEEDEEQLAEDAMRTQEQELAPQYQTSHDLRSHSIQLREREMVETIEEERERRRDELGIRRPRTPEPTHLGIRDPDSYRTSTFLAPRRSASSPLSQSTVATDATTDEIFEQVMKLSAQFNAVMALTSSLEQQHSAALSTIKVLEVKVQSLEESLKSSQKIGPETPVVTEIQSSSAEQLKTEGQHEKDSLTDLMANWKTDMEGKWSTVQEEWAQERDRLSRARAEWEMKFRLVDSGLEKISSLHTSTAYIQHQLQALQHSRHQSLGNGDVVKHNGLVTPPSPRSQSSGSDRFCRRRRRSTNSTRNISISPSRSTGSHDEDTDTTLASSEGAAEVKDLAPRSLFPNHVNQEIKEFALGVGVLEYEDLTVANTLATPESSVYKLSSSTNSKDPDHTTDQKAVDSGSPPDTIRNIQTAVGVLILSVAAAAVLYKVRSE